MTAAILWQQMEYYFSANRKEGAKETFYKFLNPSRKEFGYKEGDSWTELLCISGDKFRTAFSKIGVAYTTKTRYLSEEDPFGGKMYCSYTDKASNRTYYMRNEDEVLRKFALVRGIDEDVGRTQDDSDGETQPTIDGENQLMDIDESNPRTLENSTHIQYNTENYTDTYSEISAGAEKKIEKQILTEQGNSSSEENLGQKSISQDTSVPRLTKNESIDKQRSSVSHVLRSQKRGAIVMLTADEMQIFGVFKALIFKNCSETTGAVVEGIPRALRVFTEYYPADPKEKLIEALRIFAKGDYFQKLFLESPALLSPKFFLKQDFIESNLLSLILNPIQNGRICNTPISETERRKIKENNERAIRRASGESD